MENTSDGSATADSRTASGATRNEHRILQRVKREGRPSGILPGYLRKGDAAKYLGIGLRTLSLWQRKRIVPFHKIGRTVIYSIGDLSAAMGRFRQAAVGE